jgi:hypothetical protein
MVLGFVAFASQQVRADAGTVAADANALKGVEPYGAGPTGGLIWDYGPTTGSQAGCWSNFTDGQNFAEDVNFASATTIDTIVIFTCISPQTGTVHIKVRDDAGGAPSNTLLYDADVTPTSWVAVTDGYEVTADLPGGFAAAAGVTYWIGLSGNGFELGQYSVQTPDDGMMAQFSGPTFGGHTGVGDQMFQLYGGGGGCPAKFIDLTLVGGNLNINLSTNGDAQALYLKIYLSAGGTQMVGPFNLPANYCQAIQTGFGPTNPPIAAVVGILYKGPGLVVYDVLPIP